MEQLAAKRNHTYSLIQQCLSTYVCLYTLPTTVKTGSYWTWFNQFSLRNSIPIYFIISSLQWPFLLTYLSPPSKPYAWCLAGYNPSKEWDHSKAMRFACLNFAFTRLYVILVLTCLPTLLFIFLCSALIFPCLYRVPRCPWSSNLESISTRIYFSLKTNSLGLPRLASLFLKCKGNWLIH